MYLKYMDLTRKKLRTFIFILCLTLSFIFLYSSSSNINNNNTDNNNDIYKSEVNYIIQSVTKASVLLSNNYNNNNNKHVTKSLSELGTTPMTNRYMLFFNRVPKCGSEMFVLLITWLQGQNGFKHFRLPGGRNQDRRLNRLSQEVMVDDIKDHLRDSALPTSFDRHVYFTNFSSFGTQNPIYINLIRDPIDKMVSRYYYADLKRIRKKDTLFDDCVANNQDECQLIPGRMYDLTIPYFCGHEPWCSALNSRWALEKAKFNVEKYFKVVGVLEHLNETLSTLEFKIPQYFKGLQNLYFNELLQPHHNKNKNNPREIKASTKQKLESSLKLEYEFYHFIKNRLLNQYSLI